ncbi:MAG: hypothetical protein ACRD3W_03545, partial [Terriglobales bacterium]
MSRRILALFLLTLFALLPLQAQEQKSQDDIPNGDRPAPGAVADVPHDGSESSTDASPEIPNAAPDM